MAKRPMEMVSITNTELQMVNKLKKGKNNILKYSESMKNPQPNTKQKNKHRMLNLIPGLILYLRTYSPYFNEFLVYLNFNVYSDFIPPL